MDERDRIPSVDSLPDGVHVQNSRAVVRFEGDMLEYMDFTPHPMTPRMVWRARRRFGRSWPRAMWQALRGRGPWTELITEHEERQIEDYLRKKYGIS